MCVNVVMPAFIVLDNQDKDSFMISNKILERYNQIVAHRIQKANYYADLEILNKGHIYDTQYIFDCDRTSPYYANFYKFYNEAVHAMYADNNDKVIALLDPFVDNIYYLADLQQHPIMVDAHILLANAYLKLNKTKNSKTLMKRITNINLLPNRLQELYNLLIIQILYFQHNNK